MHRTACLRRLFKLPHKLLWGKITRVTHICEARACSHTDLLHKVQQTAATNLIWMLKIGNMKRAKWVIWYEEIWYEQSSKYNVRWTEEFNVDNKGCMNKIGTCSKLLLQIKMKLIVGNTSMRYF